MVVRATKINPAMLRWARERAGYSVEEVARRRRVSPLRILNWESGVQFPTWRQLERLSYQDYHRSPTMFFCDSPPEERYVDQEFDRLPASVLGSLHPDTLYAVRQARMRQDDLGVLQQVDAKGTKVEADSLRKQAASTASPDVLASAIDSYFLSTLNQLEPEWPGVTTVTEPSLGVEISRGLRLSGPVSKDSELTQTGSVPSHRAFGFFRNLVEETGVWVFLRSFKQKDVNGFSLNHDQFPVIYLNSAKSQEQRISTMFNEWAHIGFDFNHIELSDRQRYLKELTEVDRKIEVSCLQFSTGRAHSVGVREDSSGATVLDLGGSIFFVSPFFFVWQDYWESREDVGTESHNVAATGALSQGYYAIQKSFLGERYIRAAFEAFEADRIDEHELAATLGVKGRHLKRLGNYAWQQSR